MRWATARRRFPFKEGAPMFSQTVAQIFLLFWFVAPGSDTRLPDAAMRGDRMEVQALLSQKVDVNSAQGDGHTALHWAAYRDDVEIARSLIRSGAQVDVRTRVG